MTSLFPKIVSRFGIRNCFRLFGLLVIFDMLLFINFYGILGLYFSYFFFGMSHQFMIMNLIYSINVKYCDNVVRYTGYVFTGTAVSLIWGYIFSYIANPNNEKKTREFTLSSGELEHCFSKEIGRHFPNLCLLYGVSNLLVAFAVSFLMSVSDSGQSFFSYLSINAGDENKSLSKFSAYSARILGGIPENMGTLIGKV